MPRRIYIPLILAILLIASILYLFFTKPAVTVRIEGQSAGRTYAIIQNKTMRPITVTWSVEVLERRSWRRIGNPSMPTFGFPLTVPPTDRGFGQLNYSFETPGNPHWRLKVEGIRQPPRWLIPPLKWLARIKIRPPIGKISIHTEPEANNRGSSQPVPPMRADRLTLHFTFDELKEGKIPDASHRGHDGIVHGAEFVPGEGKDGAFRFNGVDHFVEVAGSDDFRWSRYTLSVWVKPVSYTHGIGQVEMLLSTGSPDYYCGGTAFHIDHDTFGIVYHPEGGLHPAAMTDPIFSRADDGQWHFLAVRYAYDGGMARVAVFLDGKNVKTLERVEPPLVYHGQPMHIATCYGGSSTGYGMGFAREFHGLMDELRVYSKALTDKEITDLYAADKGSFPAVH